MKRLFFLSAFSFAIVASFAFKPSQKLTTQLNPGDVTLFQPVTNCPSEICNPANSGALCTDLFTKQATCTVAYNGTARHL